MRLQSDSRFAAPPPTMANVLPPPALRSVWSEYRNRAVLTGSAALLVAGMLSLLALMPAYLVLKTAAISPADSSGASPAPEGQVDIPGLIRTQNLLNAVAPLLTATTSPSSMLSSALSLRPAG